MVSAPNSIVSGARVDELLDPSGSISIAGRVPPLAKSSSIVTASTE
jgi:hypothetical protein